MMKRHLTKIPGELEAELEGDRTTELLETDSKCM